VYQAQLWLTGGRLLGLFCFYDADCESWRAGLEVLLGTCVAVRRNESRIIPFGETSIETSHAGVITAPRWIEAQYDRASMLLLCRSHRVLCRIGKVVARGEQRDSGSADDLNRMRSATAESPDELRNCARVTVDEVSENMW
jgi:hypothetical protein